MRSIPYCVGRNLALLILQERSPVGRAKANVLNLGIAKTALPNAWGNNHLIVDRDLSDLSVGRVMHNVPQANQVAV